MYKKILVTALLIPLSVCMWAQEGLYGLLKDVEENNLTLKAARSSVEAKSYEARTGNSLEDLSISYDHSWGSPSSLGKTAEFSVSQAFDFPTVYAQRSRVADNLSQQFENEYLDLRQNTLLEAKELYIELQMLYKKEQLIEFRVNSNDYLLDLYANRYEAGDATLLEKTKFEYETLLLQETMAECCMRKIEIQNRLKELNGGVAPDIKEESEDEPLEELKPFEYVLADYQDYAPQLLAYRLQEEGAEHDLRLSKQQAVPKFELGYVHEFSTPDRDRFNGVKVGLSVPIFSNRHNVKRAKAAQTAAQLETQAASVSAEVLLTEMYQKTEMLAKSLERYGILLPLQEYYSMLVKALDAGQINVVEYFSEAYSFYDVLESKYNIEAEYKIAIARINMIYL